MHSLSNRLLSFPTSLVLLLLTTIGMASSPPPEMRLWEPAGESRAPDQTNAAKQPWLIREQPIRFSPATLKSLRTITTPLPPRILLELSDGTNYEILIESRAPGPLATIVLRGRLRTAGQSDFTLVVKEAVVAGTIHVEKRIFRIQSTGHAEHLLVEIDPEKLPPD